MDFEGSEKTEKRSSKTRISDCNLTGQGPGFGHGSDHVLSNFFEKHNFWN